MNTLVRTSAVAISIAIGSVSAFAQEGDVAAGKGVYKKCAACHFYNKEKNRVGPHLVGILDRKAGVVEKFKYSKALMARAEEGAVWDAEALDGFLTKPKKWLKGTKMSFAGLKKERDRTAIIEFLKSHSQ